VDPRLTVAIFALGLAFGSFLNVCIYRLPRGISVIHPRSSCPQCRALIPFYDNIPVMSWLILRGRCRHCRHAISPRYFIVELLTAALFLLCYAQFGFTLSAVKCSVFGFLLLGLIFTDAETGAELGNATLYLEPDQIAYYYYAFYDLNYYSRNLGMHMMTSAVTLFAQRGYQFLYLGSCYSENALYKTQFSGAEFFNGIRWSANLDELKYLIRREQQEPRQHLLEAEEYRQVFCDGDLAALAAASRFQVRTK